MKIEVKPLSEKFGAVVTGVDLSKPLSREVYDQIEDALAQHRLLSFPGQPLDDEQQLAFCQGMGTLFQALRDPSQRRLQNPFFQDVSNLNLKGEVAKNGERKYSDANLFWHTDLCYLANPARSTVLAARRLPKDPPPTEFADTAAAFDALPAQEQARLEKLEAEFSIIHSRSKVGYTEFSDRERELFKPVIHPIVNTHPRTGRKSIYVSSHTAKISGMSEESSKRLIDELVAHATQPQYVLAYPWKLNDLIIWDDSSTLHRAVPFAAKETEVRELRWNAILSA